MDLILLAELDDPLLNGIFRCGSQSLRFTAKN